MQLAAVVAPCPVLYFPAVQLAHTVCAVLVANLAAGHSEQACWPAEPMNLPAVHARHAVRPEPPAAYPAGHKVHTLFPVELAYLPLAQFLHTVDEYARDCELNLPDSQPVQ